MYMMHRLALLLCALPLACAGQVTFAGSPNPFTANANGVGQITLIWSAPGVSTTEVHLFSPSGQLFTRGDSSGSATTGDWVTNAMTFYLQDVSASTPGTTLATFTAHLAGPAGLPPSTNLLASMNNGQQLFYSVAGPTLLEVHLFTPSGPLLARIGPGQGMVNTGPWIFNGMRFFLQDVSNGNPLTYQYTVATAVAEVSATPPSATGVIFGPTPGIVPNPDNTGLGSAGLYWNAPGTSALQVRVGAPDGPLFAETGSYGFGEMTGWVTAGMVLYLQNASSGDPTSAANTLAISTVDLQPATQHYVSFATTSYGVQFYSRDSGYLLGLLYLPASVSVQDLKTGPDGTLLYVSGSDGNIYVIDPATLTITSTIDLVSFYPTGTQFVWIKNQQGKDLILTFPDASGNLLIVDPTMGTVTNTIVCDCAGAIPTYDSFNQTTYLSPLGSYGVPQFQLVVQTVTSALQLGPPLIVPTPTQSVRVGLRLGIIPLTGGTQGRLLLTWSTSPVLPFEDVPTWLSLIHDLSTGIETNAFDDQAGEVPSSSPDGQSVYTQETTAYVFGDPTSAIIAYQFGPVSLYQVTQPSGSSPVLSLVTSKSLAPPNVITPPVAQDGQFIYLETQAATFGLGYVIEGPLYIYKADPKTLQPVGAADFINTGLEYGSPPELNTVGPVAAGSYVFTGCANAPAGSFCSP
jgi:YVTN family beta-propeller protein